MQQQNQQQQMEMMTMMMEQSREESRRQSETITNLFQNSMNLSKNIINEDVKSNTTVLSGSWDGVSERVRLEIIRNPPPVWINGSDLYSHLKSKTACYINNNQMNWAEIRRVLELTFKSKDRKDMALTVFSEKIQINEDVSDNALNDLLKSIALRIFGDTEIKHERIRNYETFIDVLERVVEDNKTKRKCENYQDALKFMLNSENNILTLQDIKLISDLKKTFQNVSRFYDENTWDDEEKIMKLLRIAQEEKDSKPESSINNYQNTLNRPNSNYNSTFNSNRSYGNFNNNRNNFYSNFKPNYYNSDATNRNNYYKQNQGSSRFSNDNGYSRYNNKTQNSQQNSWKNYTEGVKCHRCNQFGHYANQCFQPEDNAKIQNPTKVLFLNSDHDFKSNYNQNGNKLYVSQENNRLYMSKGNDGLVDIEFKITKNQSQIFDEIIVKCTADSGCSSMGVISEAAAQKMGLYHKVDKSIVKGLSTATSNGETTTGQINLSIEYKNKIYEVNWDVVKDLNSDILIGNKFLNKLNCWCQNKFKTVDDEKLSINLIHIGNQNTKTGQYDTNISKLLKLKNELNKQIAEIEKQLKNYQNFKNFNGEISKKFHQKKSKYLSRSKSKSLRFQPYYLNRQVNSGPMLINSKNQYENENNQYENQDLIRNKSRKQNMKIFQTKYDTVFRTYSQKY